MRFSIINLLCASVIIGTVPAVKATQDTTSPSMQDMAKWKSDVLSKYDDIIYLDEDSKNIKEDVFFSRVVAEKRGFNLETGSAAPKRIIIRLLSDVEQGMSQAAKK